MKFNLKNLIECVPNFSEGRDDAVIQEIAGAIKSTPDVYLMGVDSSPGANRTVITFAGSPQSVLEASYNSYLIACELIDMSSQTGSHPRIGAVDVFPFVPFDETRMDLCKELAEKLGQKVGNTLGIPVYLYGNAAKVEERKALPFIRLGEYECLEERMAGDNFKPDYGPAKFNKKSGATAIGARNILIAYNINLVTKDTKLAKLIAKEVRMANLNLMKTKAVPGFPVSRTLRAIGWFIEEYNHCQVSLNLLDYRKTPIREAFDLVKSIASRHGAEVSGSELVGLAPLDALIPDKDTFCENELDREIEYLGLNSCYPFVKREKIIELKLDSLIDN